MASSGNINPNISALQNESLDNRRTTNDAGQYSTAMEVQPVFMELDDTFIINVDHIHTDVSSSFVEPRHTIHENPPYQNRPHHPNHGVWSNPHRRTNQANCYFNVGGAHMQPPEGFMPPPLAPYFPPRAVRPFGVPFVFPSLAPPPSPPLHMYYAWAPTSPAFDLAELRSKIVNQIDYYFSADNLAKDVYLKQKMDNQGWVPIKLIVGFNRVAQLTHDIPLILDALRSCSTVVEVRGDKVRRRDDWRKWLLPRHMPTLRLSSNDASNPVCMRQSIGS